MLGIERLCARVPCNIVNFFSKSKLIRGGFFYFLVKYLAFETNFIVLNKTAGRKLGKSVLPAELQVMVYEVSGLELKDHDP